MGCVASITHNTFPTQTDKVGRPVRVLIHYDTINVLRGTIVRDDATDPFQTIIKLDDGRIILATECQYAPL